MPPLVKRVSSPRNSTRWLDVYKIKRNALNPRHSVLFFCLPPEKRLPCPDQNPCCGKNNPHTGQRPKRVRNAAPKDEKLPGIFRATQHQHIAKCGAANQPQAKQPPPTTRQQRLAAPPAKQDKRAGIQYRGNREKRQADWGKQKCLLKAKPRQRTHRAGAAAKWAVQAQQIVHWAMKKGLRQKACGKKRIKKRHQCGKQKGKMK